MPPWIIRLESPDDWGGFRLAARHLLAHRVPAHAVRWITDQGTATADGNNDLFTAAAGDDAAIAPHEVELRLLEAGSCRATDTPPIALSRLAMQTCAQASLHADPDRFELLYRWLTRVSAGTVDAGDPLDGDWIRIARAARAVQREIHKMRAFVRFKPLTRAQLLPPLYIAWFEPAHHVVRANADFFVRRFTGMHWAILTPQLGLRWNGETLEEVSDCRPDQLPAADAGEALWLTYYQSTFNPARLKPQAMLREMPRRYWKNLPEARLIPQLEASARQTTDEMLRVKPGLGARADQS
ncbi:TIGR03915 family putative DNA repair protein [Diaphorobacter aerolatus]|uniref:TIGR03915 family putative DNA repair protein n=2 Tax=Diaphorobacter aerolatus TaxID=1288495 RepID=A0A7H0GQF8_9BURK|nr:TIGR03915 family putative DNA repair protein [Diaphorobacter aerolatus]